MIIFVNGIIILSGNKDYEKDIKRNGQLLQEKLNLKINKK